MHVVATSAIPQQAQPLPGNTTAKVIHWSQLRTVRAIAGIVVPGLGALAGFALSFVASTFTSVLVAGAVSVVLAGAVYGYVRRKSQAPFSPFAAQSVKPSSPVNSKPAATGDPINDVIVAQEQRAQRMLAMHGYRLYPSCRDGNCFYDAIAHQCPTTVADALELRMQVAAFARNWQQHYPQVDPGFTPIEGRAHARLCDDVAYSAIHSGLEEIGTPGCYADQIDAYFVARLLARPIVITNISGEVTLAVDEDGKSIDWLGQMSAQLIPANAVVLVHDQNHFMGVDPKVSPGADVQTRQWATQNGRPQYRKRQSATKLPLPE